MRPRRSNSLLWLSAAALCLLPVTACKSKQREKPAREADTPATEHRTMALGLRSLNPERKVTEFQKPPELPRREPIALLDAGTGKKRALRYALEDGGRELTVRARVTVREFTDGAWRDPMTLPEIRLGIGINRIAGRDDLQIRGLEAVLGDAPAAAPEAVSPAEPAGAPRQPDPAQVAQAAEQFLARHTAYLERRRGTVTMDPRGLLGRIALTPDAEASADAPYIRAQMAQMLIESVVPLPEEPIGKNARWRAVTLLYRGQTVVKQTGEYQLLSVDGKRARLSVTLTQIGEHQAVGGPDLPPSHRAELVALYWRARGELELDLASPTPIAGAMDVELRVHGRVIEMTDLGGTGRTNDYFLDSQGKLELGTTAPAKQPAQEPAGQPATTPARTPAAPVNAGSAPPG